MWSADMDFEVVVVHLKMLFLHLTANIQENSESTFQDRTQCRLTPFIFQSGTCRMQGVVATACLFRMLGLYLGVLDAVFAYRGHLNLSFSWHISRCGGFCSYPTDPTYVYVHFRGGVYWDDVTLLLSKMEFPPNCSIIFTLRDGKWYCWNC